MNKADEFLKTLIKCRYLEHLFGTKVKFQQEIEEYLAQKAKNLPDADIIPFGMYLTGKDRKTVAQLYRDWYYLNFAGYLNANALSGKSRGKGLKMLK